MDELARKAGKDPVEFRRAHAGQEPACCSRRSTSPRRNPAGASRCRPRVGRGVCRAAVVRELHRHRGGSRGRRQRRGHAAPRDLGGRHRHRGQSRYGRWRRSQGGLIFGLTAALYGEITIDKGRVQQINFHDYRMMRINETPKIEVHRRQERRGARRHRRDRRHRRAAGAAQRDLRRDRRGAAAPADRPETAGCGEEGMSGKMRILTSLRRDRHRRRRRSASGSSAGPARSTSPAAPKWRWPITAPASRPAFRPSSRRRAWSNAANISRRPPTAWSATPSRAAGLFAGGLGFKLPFGTLYSTNITPDKDTGIGNYSDQDFLNAVQRGIAP